MAFDRDSVELRRANLADAPAIAELHVRSQQATYAQLLPPGTTDRIDSGARLDQWRDHLKSGTGTVLVAIGCGLPLAGFGYLTPDRPGWSTVRSLHVQPDRRARGIGRSLLDALLDISGSHDRPHVQLHVLAANLEARAFYEHLGWRQRGPDPAHSIAGSPVRVVRYETAVTLGTRAVEPGGSGESNACYVTPGTDGSSMTQPPSIGDPA